MKTNVYLFCALCLHIVSHNGMGSCIVRLHWVSGLVVSHFIEAFSIWDSFACIAIHFPNFCFRWQWNYRFHDLCYVENSSIFRGKRDILGHKEMSTSTASCIGFTEVRGVAVDCQNHVRSFVGKYSLFLWCCIIQKLIHFFIVDFVGDACSDAMALRATGMVGSTAHA